MLQHNLFFYPRGGSFTASSWSYWLENKMNKIKLKIYWMFLVAIKNSTEMSTGYITLVEMCTRHNGNYVTFKKVCWNFLISFESITTIYHPLPIPSWAPKHFSRFNSRYDNNLCVEKLFNKHIQRYSSC